MSSNVDSINPWIHSSIFNGSLQLAFIYLFFFFVKCDWVDFKSLFSTTWKKLLVIFFLHFFLFLSLLPSFARSTVESVRSNYWNYVTNVHFSISETCFETTHTPRALSSDKTKQTTEKRRALWHRQEEVMTQVLSGKQTKSKEIQDPTWRRYCCMLEWAEERLNKLWLRRASESEAATMTARIVKEKKQLRKTSQAASSRSRSMKLKPKEGAERESNGK